MITTAITFLTHDVEIYQATRHDDCVAVTVKSQDGHRVVLFLHEDVWSLIYEAVLDAEPYQPAGWSVPVDTACPDDPDGLHHAGCGCEEVAAR